MSSQRKKSGLLAGVTPESYPIGDIALPFTIVLRSVAAGRQISLSFDETLESLLLHWTNHRLQN